ncbi:MAG TPA: CBS domain-containing protein [Anaerolineales bacterium]|nr:CBS domain-containing protein [Anaerolineales bacterium]
MPQAKFIRDLMTVGVPTCKWDSPIVDIARFLLEKNVEAMCVLDVEGHGIGVVGVDELVWAYAREGYETLTAEDIMSEGVPELPADISLALAAQMMKDKGIRIAYMLHNSAGIIYPAAYISYRHILRHMAAKDENDLKDLGLAADRKTPIEQFIEKRDEARRKAGLI